MDKHVWEDFLWMMFFDGLGLDHLSGCLYYDVIKPSNKIKRKPKSLKRYRYIVYLNYFYICFFILIFIFFAGNQYYIIRSVNGQHNLKSARWIEVFLRPSFFQSVVSGLIYSFYYILSFMSELVLYQQFHIILSLYCITKIILILNHYMCVTVNAHITMKVDLESFDYKTLILLMCTKRNICHWCHLCCCTKP